MCTTVFLYRLVYDFGFSISFLDTLVSNMCNCHFVATVPTRYEWSGVIWCEMGWGSGVMMVCRSYVQWFLDRDS